MPSAWAEDSILLVQAQVGTPLLLEANVHPGSVDSGLIAFPVYGPTIDLVDRDGSVGYSTLWLVAERQISIPWARRRGYAKR